jgi:CspA family cold shock protein
MDPDIRAAQIDRAWAAHRAEQRRSIEPAAAPEWETGTVRFYRASQGFGFVTADADAADIYVSATTLAACGVAELAVGDRVEFQRREKPGARSAIAERIKPTDRRP